MDGPDSIRSIVAEREELTETGLGSTARCRGRRRHRQANSVRVCSPTSRRVASLRPRSAGRTALTPAPRTLLQTGSCRRCSLIHPLHVVVDVPSRMTLFRATADIDRGKGVESLHQRGSTRAENTPHARGCTRELRVSDPDDPGTAPRTRGSTPAPPHDRGQSPGPLCERGDQPLVVWEAGARRRSTPCAGTKPIGVLLPVLPMRPPRARGDQTNVRYILIRADGPERQTCHLRRSVQLRPKARGDRSATQEAQAQRKTAPRVRRTERTQARNVFAVCRDSNGWLARPAPRGACWLERKPCGSFIRHRAREHPQAEARLDAYLDATGTAGAQRTRRCSTR